eukprot:1141280-Pelagomonas_calceolata.AAC.5
MAEEGRRVHSDKALEHVSSMHGSSTKRSSTERQEEGQRATAQSRPHETRRLIRSRPGATSNLHHSLSLQRAAGWIIAAEKRMHSQVEARGCRTQQGTQKQGSEKAKTRTSSMLTFRCPGGSQGRQPVVHNNLHQADKIKLSAWQHSGLLDVPRKWSAHNLKWVG